MGFLSGLVGPALTVASNAEGTYQGAQAQAANQKTQQIIQSYMLARQQRQMDIENALKQKQGEEAGAHATLYQNESNPAFAGQKAAAVAAAEWPSVQQRLDLEHQNRLTEIAREGGNALAVAQENIRAAQARQQAEQAFIATQNDKNRQNTAGIAAANRSATASNQAQAQGAAMARLTQTQKGQFIPTMESLLGFGPLATPPATGAPGAVPAPSSGTKTIWDMEQP